jgi:hypothetical protein
MEPTTGKERSDFLKENGRARTFLRSWDAQIGSVKELHSFWCIHCFAASKGCSDAKPGGKSAAKRAVCSAHKGALGTLEKLQEKDFSASRLPDTLSLHVKITATGD